MTKHSKTQTDKSSPKRVIASRKFFSKKEDGISVFGAREHNLKNINVFIPRNKITLITGLSGSGKSTLAFDTLYGEGQRRYLESLSVYARYFIDQMKKPKVDLIQGLSPSIAINQKTISFNPRSTVGTLTETYDFLRLLYAKIAEVSCPRHKETLKSQSAEEIAEDISKAPKNSTLFILSPIARGKKGEFEKELNQCLSLGFDRAKIDGQWRDIGKIHKLEKRKDHYIDIVMDCITWKEADNQIRINTAVRRALDLSGSFVKAANNKGFEKTYSMDFSCPKCDYSILELEPKMFSFNSPKGACPSCNGTGLIYDREYFDSDDTADESENEHCPECKGTRLSQEALQVKIKNRSIDQVSAMSLDRLEKFIKSLKYSGVKKQIAEKIKAPLLERLSFLQELNLSYLSLDRSLSALSGGEAQRVRLAGQLSSPVIGVMYVLDEPSIGLHSKDHHRILKAIQKIRDRGNTVIIVEHDEESIYKADKIIDLGPGAGKHGGFLIAEGTINEIKKNKKSLTGAYLSKRKKIPVYKSRYNKRANLLCLKGLRANNLKNIDVNIPLSCLVGVSGVSGSGKSSVVTDTIYPLLLNSINKTHRPVGAYSQAEGVEPIQRVIQINQKPIGRTPRSNPVTYIGVFQMIRNFFAYLPSAKIRGWKASSFSFNVPGGRCENCKGAGVIKLEMRFLPNVFTTCEVCNGKRYNPDILNITYKNKNIYDILNMSVETAVNFFKNHPYIHHRLNFLKEVGLGYIRLGQNSVTLSGGEAQRVKLSRELAKKINSHSFYILDEPTTGLHFEDVKKLIAILRQFSDQGHTVVVIEHHLDILKSCDYLIDLGPKGGEEGGYIVAQGTPQQVASNPKSWTGQYLKKYL
ncbi:MAG: excinuclease ABC subunit UvrA [Oligoflexia bacterium]|nr:excinuclease ABC subunit UvrA [Oligoflexia bacterium]